MHVCHVSAGYAPFVGGAQTYLQAIAERTARAGHCSTVVATTATQVDCFWLPSSPQVPERAAELNGVQVQYWRLGYLPGSPWSFYALRRLAPILSELPGVSKVVLPRLAAWMPRVPGLARAIERLEPAPDLVHAVNIALEWPVIAAARYARRRGIPLVVTPFAHVGEREVQRNYTMRHQVDAMRRAGAVVVQTTLERDALSALGVPADRIHRLGMGVDLDELSGGDAARFRAQYGAPGPIVLFMGTLTADKGVQHVCEAMRTLWARGVDATLALAGKTIVPGGFDDYHARLPEDARRRIRLLGQIGGQAKQDALAAADVFVLPSRVDSFGIVYLEAWTYGKPVIGARAGGVPEVIAHEDDGLLVGFGDVPALAGAIGRLLGDGILRARLGERGRQKVAARFTWDRIYDQLWQVYQSVLPHARQDSSVYA